MSAREGMGRDGTSVMNVDEALAYADDNSPLPFKTVNTWKCVLTLADEVHSLREQNRRLRPSAPVFDMEAAVNAFGDAFYGDWEDGSPSTSWRTCPGLQPEVTPAITKALTAALPHLQPDMEALRREAERYRFLRTPTAALRRIGRVNLMVGRFDEDLDKAIDDALAAQRDTSEGGMER